MVDIKGKMYGSLGSENEEDIRDDQYSQLQVKYG